MEPPKTYYHGKNRKNKVLRYSIPLPPYIKKITNPHNCVSRCRNIFYAAPFSILDTTKLNKLLIKLTK